MKISVLLKTAENRGDHSADVIRAFESEPAETIEHLVYRLLGPADTYSSIELRIIAESKR